MSVNLFLCANFSYWIEVADNWYAHKTFPHFATFLQQWTIYEMCEMSLNKNSRHNNMLTVYLLH